MRQKDRKRCQAALTTALHMAGGRYEDLGDAVARAIGRPEPFSKESVRKWFKYGVSAERAVHIEMAFPEQVHRTELRPDLFVFELPERLKNRDSISQG